MHAHLSPEQIVFDTYRPGCVINKIEEIDVDVLQNYDSDPDLRRQAMTICVQVYSPVESRNSALQLFLTFYH